jgi:(2Fe-2S) ferredoxin
MPWSERLSPSDLPDIVSHIQGGEPVERLIENVDPALRDLILTMIDMGLVDF